MQAKCIAMPWTYVQIGLKVSNTAQSRTHLTPYWSMKKQHYIEEIPVFSSVIIFKIYIVGSNSIMIGLTSPIAAVLEITALSGPS